MTMTFPQPDIPPLRGGAVLRWGVIGPGEIANDFTSTLHANSDQRVVAVGSRSRSRAEVFAGRHGVARAHDSYEALVADPDVDIVYVATPHPQHVAQALLAIDAGKHVLVEKPMTTSRADTERIADAARAAGVYAAEAMWTRYLPHSAVLARLLVDGALGEVTAALIDVGWPRPFDPADRMFDPAQGGGALLDAGVYGLWLAQFTTGPAVTVHAEGRLTDTGVDAQSIALLRSASDAQATVTTTMLGRTDGCPTIVGTAGTVRFTDHFVFPASFEFATTAGATPWTEPSGLHGREGLVWQATAAAQYIAEGRTESPVHSLADSITLATTMDAVRAAVGAR
jgi:predicted dehydrogenase